MTDHKMTERPGYTGALNAAILSRVEQLGAALGIDDLACKFPHLKVRDGSWRRPITGPIDVAQHIDHTQLKAAATRAEITKLCDEAKTHHFKAVCVNGCRVAQSAEELHGTDVRVACVCGFPLGQMTPAMKAAEAREEVRNGAKEVDMVINIGALIDKDYKLVYEDVKGVCEACRSGNAITKVIFETCLLTQSQIIDAAIICVAAGAEFVKTSTGFSTAGSTPEGIDVMLAVVGNAALVKAAGGVRDYSTAKQYIQVGVSRIGTSSGIAIIKGAPVSHY